MKWIAFTYSLPAQSSSTQRVALWRRLRKLGAVSPTGSLWFLPAREECVEAFQWLVQEIQHTQGEALVVHVEHLEGLSDHQLVDRFHAASEKEYAEIATQVAELENILTSGQLATFTSLREMLAKLRRQHAEIAQTDYFQCPAGVALATEIANIGQRLSPASGADEEGVALSWPDYVGKRWVTRPRPHVDRLACIWFIRRFIDPAASIRYSTEPEPDEVAFDMAGSHFGHQGNLCTFETLLRSFRPDSPALGKLAEIVHEIDLRDGRYLHPESTGIDAVLQGWRAADMSDQALEDQGTALFEGLYRSFTLT